MFHKNYLMFGSVPGLVHQRLALKLCQLQVLGLDGVQQSLAVWFLLWLCARLLFGEFVVG